VKFKPCMASRCRHASVFFSIYAASGRDSASNDNVRSDLFVLVLRPKAAGGAGQKRPTKTGRIRHVAIRGFGNERWPARPFGKGGFAALGGWW